MVPVLVTEIYNEFIDKNATSPVNIDCKVMDQTEENLKNPNRWSFDEAAVRMQLFSFSLHRVIVKINNFKKMLMSRNFSHFFHSKEYVQHQSTYII